MELMSESAMLLDNDDDDMQSVDTDSCLSEGTMQDQELDDEDSMSSSSTPIIFSRPVICDVSRVTKTKKRVSFPENDDHLVRIREIPPREESPLSEELMPCDPYRLVENLSSMRLNNAFSSRKLDITAQLAALQPTVSSFNALSKEIITRQATRNFIKKSNIGLVAAARATTDGETINRTDTSGGNRQKVAAAIKNITAPDTIETLRVENTFEQQSEKKVGKRHVTQTRTSTHHKKTDKHDKTIGRKSKHTSAGVKDTAGYKNTGKHKNKRHTPSPSSSASNTKNIQGSRQSHSPHPPVAIKMAHSRTESSVNNQRLKQIINIDTKTLNSGEQLFNTEVGLFTNPKVHSSPYRAASAGPLRGRHMPGPSKSDLYTDLMDSRTCNLRSETGKSSGGLIQSKRLYAWQMANGIAMQNPHLETPCIAPMWDLQRSNSTVDTLPLT